ncbi:MAG: flagellar filament capping protein FliD [Nitrosomonadales bacterium]|nr:flagellar filament capping protein FliD [Nitrosomonadales bacterium]
MATTSTTATGTSSLDVNSIVTQLMTVERQPIAKLNTREASYQAKLSAFGSVKGAVSGFQSALQGLNSPGKFNTLKATPSDATVVSASATSIAVAGTYSLDVTSLSQAQKLVATGQTSSTAAISDGVATTVTFDFGAISGGTLTAGVYSGATFASNGSGTKSITIDSSNNSLQGIRDAINSARIGVTATIVNDGTAAPYRLVLASDNNGVSNSLKITTSGGDGTIDALMAHDPAGLAAAQHLNQTVTAQNAVFKVNGISVSKTSNTVSDVIQGVTFTLNKEAATANLTVARDTAGIISSISSFVKAYNDLAATLKNVSAYDSSTKQAATLQGDSTVRTLQAQLRGMLSTPVAGASGALTTLADIGITAQRDGSLALNQAKLDSAIASNFSDVASLFTSVGKATDSLVSFNNATTATKAGSYAVNITQIATQGKLSGGSAAVTNIQAGVNDALSFSVNGISASVVLTANPSYTATTLAAELQSRLNSVTALANAGISVAVTQTTGVLTITSTQYGSSSSVTITGGNGATDLLGIPTQDNGVDVAGSIGGASATGSGQILSAANGDPQGLSILINDGTTGARGTLNYSQGYASTLSKWSASMLAGDGPLTSATNGINSTIKDIGKRRSDLETRLIGVEKRYRAQFTALDGMLTNMNQTSIYLTQQLAKL